MILCNNRGISLVILVIAITLIAILGASFVSLVGTKQRGFLYQKDSYLALNIANSGIEYAIRFASDASLGDSDNFFITPLTTKTFSFGGGTFEITYQYNNPCNTNDNITINAILNGRQRQVRLYNFRRYLSRFTHVPVTSVRPSKLGNAVHIPIINNNNSQLTITALRLAIQGGGVDKKLEEICFSANSSDTCTGSGSLNRTIPQTGTEISFAITDFSGTGHNNISSDEIIWCHLIFQASSLNGSYTTKYYIGLAGEQPSILKFNIPIP